MKLTRSLAHLALPLVGIGLLGGCNQSSGAEFASKVAIGELRGRAIDGSEDPRADAGPVELARTANPLAGEARTPAPEDDSTTPDSESADELTEDLETSADSGQPGNEPAPEAASEPSRQLGRMREDGVREIAFKELSMEDLDPDSIVDSLLFPEEYPDQLVPQAILDLDGQRIAVTGYMIPGRIKKGGIVRDFLLVRDLMACCFGGMPKPDEWIEVDMAEGQDAEYHRYVPLIVTGTLTVGDDIDEDSLSPAVFKMVATEVRRVE